MSRPIVGYAQLDSGVAIAYPIRVYAVGNITGDNASLRDATTNTGTVAVYFNGTTAGQDHARLPGVVFRNGCYNNGDNNTIVFYQKI